MYEDVTYGSHETTLYDCSLSSRRDIESIEGVYCAVTPCIQVNSVLIIIPDCKYCSKTISEYSCSCSLNDSR